MLEGGNVITIQYLRESRIAGVACRFIGSASENN